MSELWRAKVLKNEGNKLELLIKPVHPDAGQLSADKNFIMLFLTSEAYGFDENYNRIPISPLGELIPFDKSYLPEEVEPYTEKVIKNIKVKEYKNLPWDFEEIVKQEKRRLIHSGIKPNSEELEAMMEDFYDNFWDDPDKVPYAIYEVEVHDNKWIQHLKEGMVFETAAYTYNGPWLGIDM